MNTTTQDEKAILHFFRDFYAIQLGITEEDTYKSGMKCLNPHAPGPDHTYELWVTYKKHKSRRMAIGPLGENSGSKSKCFKVIYDDILVVKIPPSPITDFEEYVEDINAERRIVEGLSPNIECIAPSVSALLKKIPQFTPSPDLSPEQLELGYINLLRKKPWFQDYLKINNSFVFFMNLSRYSFLGHIIENIHDTDKRVHEEILSQFDILWNLMAFEGVYGSESGHIFFTINEIYTEYEDKVNKPLRRYGVKPHAYMFKRKEWFLLALADKKIPTDNDMPESFYKELNLLISQTVMDNIDGIEEYRDMMRNFVQDKMFKQNKIHFKGIITNILELLFRLKEREVAIRDLKPDNIFVMSDNFSQDAEKFLLGLIDFETAVSFNVRDNKLKQPLLAGTPSYATPSHLVSNEILVKIFGNDLPRVLHLQDWHASLAMIYYVVTGDRLFDRARRWISGTWKIMQQAKSQKISLEEAFKRSSYLFWKDAVTDFKEKLSQNEFLLKSIYIQIPENIREMLGQETLMDMNITNKKMIKAINAQQFFRAPKTRNDLIKCSYEVINRCRENWEKGVNVPETSPEIRNRIIQMLHHLETLKLNLEEGTRFVSVFKRDPLTMSTYEILTYMFNIIFNAMYDEQWGIVSMEECFEECMITEKYDPRAEATIANEQTISYEGTITPEDTLSFDETISYEDTLHPD